MSHVTLLFVDLLIQLIQAHIVQPFLDELLNFVAAHKLAFSADIARPDGAHLATQHLAVEEVREDDHGEAADDSPRAAHFGQDGSDFGGLDLSVHHGHPLKVRSLVVLKIGRAVDHIGVLNEQVVHVVPVAWDNLERVLPIQVSHVWLEAIQYLRLQVASQLEELLDCRPRVVKHVLLEEDARLLALVGVQTAVVRPHDLKRGHRIILHHLAYIVGHKTRPVILVEESFVDEEAAPQVLVPLRVPLFVADEVETVRVARGRDPYLGRPARFTFLLEEVAENLLLVHLILVCYQVLL